MLLDPDVPPQDGRVLVRLANGRKVWMPAKSVLHASGTSQWHAGRTYAEIQRLPLPEARDRA